MGCSIPINISGGESFPGLVGGGGGERRNLRGFAESSTRVSIILLSGAYILLYSTGIVNNIHIVLLLYRTGCTRFYAPSTRRLPNTSKVVVAAYLFRKRLFTLPQAHRSRRRTEIEPHTAI